MIGKGHPRYKRKTPKHYARAAQFFFSRQIAICYSRVKSMDGVNLGQVVPLDGGPMNQPVHPKLEGFPYSKGARLQGVGE